MDMPRLRSVFANPRCSDAPPRPPSELPHCWRVFKDVVPHADRVLLHGVSGTGKTLQALTAGLRDDQLPFYLVLTEDTPAAEIRGMYVPHDGGFAWQDGPAVAAWRRGGRLVLDELDHASGDILSLLMAITDSRDTARLSLPTCETVRPAAGFTVIATMNGDPDHLPPALRDRFAVCLEIDAVHPAAIAALPPEVGAAALATAFLPPERRLSVRAWQTFATLRPHCGEETAAEAVFGRARAGEVLDALRLRAT
jgi:MoxR-like ATPase